MAVAVKKTTMEALDHYLLIAILSFLQPEEILACEVQNKRFRLASVCHDSVWLVHCGVVWKKTGFDALWVPPSIPLLERIRGVCTIAQMRKALASYETTALVEKKDFIVLLRAKILFGITACTRGSRGGYVPPVWAGEVFNDGKAAWVFAKKESKRNAALESELLLGGGLWDLTYKNQSEHTFDLQFYSNHEMSSTSHGDQVCCLLLWAPLFLPILLHLLIAPLPSRTLYSASTGCCRRPRALRESKLRTSHCIPFPEANPASGSLRTTTS